MGLRELSKDQVSRMCRGCMSRSSCSATDRCKARIRIAGSMRRANASVSVAAVRQKAPVIDYAVHESGVRAVLRIDVGEAGTERVLDQVPALSERPCALRCACASPTRTWGLRSVTAWLRGCRWQRGTVPFLKDTLGHCGKAPQR
jgi:putative transposase